MPTPRATIPAEASAPPHPDVTPATELIDVARSVARDLLAQLHDGGQRWRHTQAVASRAAQAAEFLTTEDGAVVQAAAWLHDIGYAPSLQRCGFHPLDGAISVRDDLGWPLVAGLVAHHSGARFVAAQRELGPLMRQFADPRTWTGPLADALTWADQTTGPGGETVTVEARLREMLARHGPDSPNARCNAERAPVLVAAVRATEARLASPTRRGVAGPSGAYAAAWNSLVR